MTEAQLNFADNIKSSPSILPGKIERVSIYEQTLINILEHARVVYPNECCGVLIGRRDQQFHVCSAEATKNRNRARTRDRYEIDPREILRLDRAAEREACEIVGFYHSHPDHPAVPSATDLEFAWQGYLYLIVGVTASGEETPRSWIFEENLGRFRELEIAITSPPSPSLQAERG